MQDITKDFMKKSVTSVRSGDTVRVHQKIKEGNKERVQVFQGLVIKTSKTGSHLSRITVRRIASGIGVEKSFLINSPLVTKVEVTKRSKVRRNYLSYMRARTGKSARLASVDFDRNAVNTEQVEETPETASQPTEAAQVEAEPVAKTEENEPETQEKEEPTAEEAKDSKDADNKSDK